MADCYSAWQTPMHSPHRSGHQAYTIEPGGFKPFVVNNFTSLMMSVQEHLAEKVVIKNAGFETLFLLSSHNSSPEATLQAGTYPAFYKPMESTLSVICRPS